MLANHYFYMATNFDVDMKNTAADPTTHEWWAERKPCRQPLNYRAPGEWWAGMEEVLNQA